MVTSSRRSFEPDPALSRGTLSPDSFEPAARVPGRRQGSGTPPTAWRWPVAIAVLVVGIWAVMTSTAFTRQGINFQVSSKPIPLYVKAIAFLHRHYQYQVLARDITRGCRSDRERLQAVYDWTRQNIRPTPAGWPVVDDHILHIIIRGHGVHEQIADVFATLATYAGVPACWWPGPVTLTFAKVDGYWTMLDVGNGLIFTDPEGRLREVHDLIAHPALIDAAAGELTVMGRPYSDYVRTRVRTFKAPAVLRAQQQMPLPRLVVEVRHAVQRVWEATTQPRPAQQ